MKWTVYLSILILYYGCDHSAAQNDVIYVSKTEKEDTSDSLDFDVYLDWIDHCGSLKDEPMSAMDSIKVVNEDLAFIKNVVNQIPACQTLNQFLELTDTFLDEDSLSLGYELDYTIYYLYGSSRFSIKCHIISYQSLILHNSIEFRTDKKLIKTYRDATTLEISCEYDKLWSTYWKTSNLKIYKKLYPKSYWLIPFEQYRDRKYEAIDYFSYLPAFERDIIDQYRVDYSYLRKAMDHIRYLLTQKDTTTLESLLFSPFPTGRDMAVGGLSYLKNNTTYQPSLEVVAQMNKIKSDSTIFKIGMDASHWGDLAPRLSLFNEFDSFLQKY